MGADRETVWRRFMIGVSIVALLVCAAAIYGIRRLEAKPKPHVHTIREVNKFEMDRGGRPQPK
jgi:hypothetical protein